MARIRSLKPDFWLDRKLARSCSRDARMLYMGLWNQADEHARANGDEAVIKGQVFPYDNDVMIADLLDELVTLGRVQRYEYDGDPYLFLPKLAKHQRLEPGKAQSKLPEPPDPSLLPHPPRSEPVSEKIVAESAPIAAVAETKDASLWDREQGTGNRGQVARAERGADKPAPTVTQRSKRITDAYTAAVPLSNWPAVNGVVIKALKSERYADEEIHAAMLRLAVDGRSVTAETLRTELEGLAPRASPNRATVRTQTNLAIVAQLEAEQERGA